MKKLLLILLWPAIIITTAKAQSITPFNFNASISPYSIQFFGQTPSTAKITIGYGMFEAVGFHSFKTLYDEEGVLNNSIEIEKGHRIMKRGKQLSNYTYSGNYIGFFINPVQLKINNFLFRGGIGWMLEKFPDIQGKNLQFQFKAAYMITKNIGFQYSHISSGFHLLKQFNPGVDNISIIFSLPNP